MRSTRSISHQNTIHTTLTAHTIKKRRISFSSNRTVDEQNKEYRFAVTLINQWIRLRFLFFLSVEHTIFIERQTQTERILRFTMKYATKISLFVNFFFDSDCHTSDARGERMRRKKKRKEGSSNSSSSSTANTQLNHRSNFYKYILINSRTVINCESGARV